MALIPCPDCGREVSDEASACPDCGRPVRVSSPQTVVNVDNRSGCLTVLAILFLLLLLGGLLIK